MKATLYDYLVNQPNADHRLSIFSDSEQRKIEQARWCKNLYQRVLNNKTYNKLTENDWTVLKNRINSMPVKSDEKTKILN